jgi:hypothetical protein
MRRARVFAFAVVSGGVAIAIAACSLQDGGAVSPEGVDAANGEDATLVDGNSIAPNDAAPPPADASTRDASDAAIVPDAGHDAGSPTFTCGVQQVANCATNCPNAPLECPSTQSCIGSCYPGCVGFVFECNACGADGGLALARCEPEDAAAYAECLGGLDRCACATGNASACPGGNQTCENNECFECGEPDGGNQVGHSCESGGGKKCQASGACNN